MLVNRIVEMRRIDNSVLLNILIILPEFLISEEKKMNLRLEEKHDSMLKTIEVILNQILILDKKIDSILENKTS
jgi:hypothetical protein